MKRKSQTKLYGKTVKSFLSDKTRPDEKIKLIEKDKIIATGIKTAVLNTFFSTIISNFNIPEYPVCDPISNDITDPVLKSVLKYKDHPSIEAIEILPRHRYTDKNY